MNDMDELKAKMATASKILQWELADLWGHVSCKTPDGNRFLLLPLRPPINPAIPDDEVLEFDLNGNLVAGRRDQPEEIFFYTCLYRAKKDIGAVIHVHPPVATALAAAGKKIVPMHHNAIRFGKSIPVTPWLYGIWQQDGERAARTMGKNCAVIIKGHGANVTGRTLQEACLNTIELEHAAKMTVWAGAAGKSDSPFSPAVIKRYRSLEAIRAERGQYSSSSPAWVYYERMVKRGERWNTW